MSLPNYSLPDYLLDPPGDPWCGVCGLCHPPGEQSYACAEQPSLEEAAEYMAGFAEALRDVQEDR